MRRALAVILIFVSVVGCSAAPAPQVLHPEYRYVASYPPGPFTLGAAFHVVWTPELVRRDSAEPYDVRGCACSADIVVRSLKQYPSTLGKFFGRAS